MRGTENQCRQSIKGRERPHDQTTQRQLADFVRLPPCGCEPPPEQQDNGHEYDGCEAT